MSERHQDGSAGDAKYGVIGRGYVGYRQPDPHIAGFITAALGDARTVLNVGAGAGSYEPVDRDVTAVEPSASMRDQRPMHLPRAIDAVAEHLPFADKTFDAGMTTFSAHPWSDLAARLTELRRAHPRPGLILSCHLPAPHRPWQDASSPGILVV